VREVIWDGDRAAGVVVDFEDGTRRRIESRVLIDASGQTALIARQLGLRETDPVLRHAAYFTHYKGAQRDEGIDEGATLVMQTQSEKTWFWYIPQPDDTISVGVVGPTGYLKSLGDDPDAIFEASVAECPALQARIEGSEKERDARVLRDFSYVSKRIAGDGWVMAGDAFGFLDPIYSTGVFLALKSGEFAGDAAIDALAHDDPSAERLGQFGNTYLSGMEAMRKLVYAYYDNDFTIPAFLKEHPHCREHIVNLLVGNVYRESTGDLFELMARFTHLPPTRSFPGPGAESTTSLERAS
jgi:flavin-dependent dehydrogenase